MDAGSGQWDRDATRQWDIGTCKAPSPVSAKGGAYILRQSHTYSGCADRFRPVARKLILLANGLSLEAHLRWIRWLPYILAMVTVTHVYVCVCECIYLPVAKIRHRRLQLLKLSSPQLETWQVLPNPQPAALSFSFSLSHRALFNIFKVCLCRFLLSSTNTSRPTETTRPKLSCLQTHSVPSHLIPFHALSGKCFSH